MKESDGKWKRKWRNMKENERKWKKMSENERKWKKMKESEEKWKNEKMKKKEKWKNEKKGKNVEKWWKKKEKWKKWIHTQNPRRFPWFCFGMCLFPKENQQPVLGGNRFSEEKWQFSLDMKQKYTFYRRKSTKKKSLRSAHLTIIILLE